MVAFGGRRRHAQAADDPGGRRPRAARATSVIDQHFDQRNRYGRLLMIVAQSPQLLGIGVDEDTAAVVTVEPDGRQMLRSSAGARSRSSTRPRDRSPTPTRPSAPLRCWPSAWCCTCCPQGPTFDLTDARPGRPAPSASTREDAAEIAEAETRPAPAGPRHRRRATSRPRSCAAATARTAPRRAPAEHTRRHRPPGGAR